MVRTPSGESFAVADLPGLIEGASQGVGLGTQFLRHIERTRVILHVIDMSASEGRDPYEDYIQINKELETYNLRLMERPQIIVANKMDMPESQENLKKFKKKLAANYDEFDELPQIFPISSLAYQGLDNLLEATAELLDKHQNSSCIQKTKWPKKKSTMALMKTSQPLTSVGMTMPLGSCLVKNLKNSLI